jgi:hypothetical protein
MVYGREMYAAQEGCMLHGVSGVAIVARVWRGGSDVCSLLCALDVWCML